MTPSYYCVIKMMRALSVILILSACKDEGKLAALEGNWQSERHEIRSDGPVAIDETDENFIHSMEFKSDGTVIMKTEDNITQGAWEWIVPDKKIQIDADLGIGLLTASEIFDVTRLTKDQLVLYAEKKDTFVAPKSNTPFTATAKVTLYFSR